MRASRSSAVVMLLAVAVAGCTKSVTCIVSRADQNPLKQVAAQASIDYLVRWREANTLELRDNYYLFSVLTAPLFGISSWAFCAELHYADHELISKFWFERRNILTLFLNPWSKANLTYGWTSPRGGGLVGSRLRRQMQQILDWAGVAQSERREQYGPPEQWGPP